MSSVLQDIVSAESGDKLQVRILDTVYFDESKNIRDWLYSTKSGHLSKKPTTDVVYEKILDRFKKFSLSNPFNIAKKICWICNSRTHTRIALTTEETEDWFRSFTSNPNAVTDGIYLQCYVQPRANGNVLCIFENSSTGVCARAVDMTAGDEMQVDQLLNSQELLSRVSSMFSEVSKFNQTVDQLHVVIDDREQLWVSNITSVSKRAEQIQKSLKLNFSATDDKKLEDQGESVTALTSISDRSESLPDIHRRDIKKKRVKTPVNAASKDNEPSTLFKPSNYSLEAATKANSESDPRGILFRRVGKVFLSQIGPEDLPGLLAWTIARSRNLMKDGKEWQFTLETYLRQDITARKTGMDDDRLRERNKLPLRSVLLAQSSEEFLLGKINMDNEDALLQAWRDSDSQAQQDISQKYGVRCYENISVCGNTFRICTKLDSIRLSGYCSFESTKAEPKHQVESPKEQKSPVSLITFEETSRTGNSKMDRNDEKPSKAPRSEEKSPDRSVMASQLNALFSKQKQTPLPPPVEEIITSIDESKLADCEKSFLSETKSTVTSAAQVSAKAEALKALSMRVRELEALIDTLSKKLRNAENEAQKAYEKMRESSSILAVERGKFQKASSDLVRQHDEDLLAVRQQFSKSMSVVSSNGQCEDGSLSTGMVDSSHAAQKLVDQLKDVQRRLQQQSDDFERERKSLQAEAAQQHISNDRQRKTESADARALVNALEDKVENMTKQLRDASFSASVLQKKEADYDKRRHELEAENSKLRIDLKAVQQSLNQVFRIETSQGLGTDDADSVVQSVTSQSNSKIRQLANKIEFLKSQLSIETSNRENLENQVRAMENKTEETRQDTRHKLSLAETLKFEAIEEAESRMRVQLQERLDELGRMQMKVNTLQSQLQDSISDVMTSKQKEENVKVDIARLQSQNMTMKAEIEVLHAQIDELGSKNDDNDMLKREIVNIQSAMRRADNEKEYLKSQLSSEIATRTEQQAQVASLSMQLQDSKSQWQNDVTSMHSSSEDEQRRMQDEISNMLHVKMTLEGEVARLSEQNKELLQWFTKTRDTLRMEQVNLETARTANRRLQERIDAISIELSRKVNDMESLRSEGDQNLKAVQSSFTELDKKRQREISILQAELKLQFSMTNDAQKSMMAMQKTHELEELKGRKSTSLLRIAVSFQSIVKLRLSAEFYKWKRGVEIIKNDIGEEGRMLIVLERARAEAKLDREAEARTITENLRQQHGRLMAETFLDYEKKIDGIKTMFHADKQETINKLMVETYNDARAKEKEWAQIIANKDVEMKEYKVTCDNESAAMQNNLQAKYSHDVSALLNEAQVNFDKQKREALNEEARRWQDALSKKVIELELERKTEVDQLLVDNNIRIQITKEEGRAETEKQIRRKDAEKIVELKNQQNELEKEKADAVQSENKKCHDVMLRELHKLSTAKLLELEAACDKLRKESSKSLHDMQLLHETEILHQKSQLDADKQECMKRLQDESQRDLTNAVAAETLKWSAMLEELDRKMNLELIRAREIGWAERDKQAEDEVNQLQLATDAALEQRVQEAIKMKNELDHQREEALVHQAELLHQKQLDAIAEAMKVQKEAIDIEWEERSSMMVKRKSEEMEAIMEDKLMEEEKLTSQARLEAQGAAKKLIDLEKKRQTDIARKDDEIMEVKHRMIAEAARMEVELQTQRDVLEEQKIAALKRLSDEKDDERSSAVMTALLTAAAEKKKAIDELNAARDAEQALALIKKEQEHEVIIKRHMDEEKVMEETISQLTTSLSQRDKQLEETQDQLFDVENDFRDCKKKNVFSLIRSAATLMRHTSKADKKFEQLKKDLKQEMERIQAEAEVSINDARQSNQNICRLLVEWESFRQHVKEILVSHKTEFLMQTRDKLQACEQALSQVITFRESLKTRREVAMGEIAQVEVSVKALEEEIREHNKQSSLVGGRINVAHARRKKRLNEDLENVLAAMDSKRNELSDTERSLLEASDTKEEKEEEMVAMEQEMVQILIEQQKIVLNLISDAKDTNDKGKLLSSKFGVS